MVRRRLHVNDANSSYALAKGTTSRAVVDPYAKLALGMIVQSIKDLLTSDYETATEAAIWLASTETEDVFDFVGLGRVNPAALLARGRGLRRSARVTNLVSR